MLGFSHVLSPSKFEKMLQQGSSRICKCLLETFLVKKNGCINLNTCIPSGLYVKLFSFLLFQIKKTLNKNYGLDIIYVRSHIHLSIKGC